MMAELYGKVTGCSGGKGGSMHLIDLETGFLASTPIVGSTVPIAVGTALASAMAGQRRVTVAFFGDAVAEQGVLCESLNFALLKRLPVVFVCENNGYSVYSPLCVRQPATREIFQIPQGHGMESYQGDGNDVVQVYEMAKKAVAKARNGEGPTFLEFKTYRWREHCGPNYDNDLGYRTEEECKEWMNRCPIMVFRESLLREGVFSQSELDDVARKIEAEIEQAVRFAKESPFPGEKDLLSHVYAG
jgi:pyruvate dehydrogenase E1 component alpha subunit